MSFPCFYCEKFFRSSCDLKSNRRLYTGEKSYTCLRCGNSLADRSAFKRQQLTHTEAIVRHFYCWPAYDEQNRYSAQHDIISRQQQSLNIYVINKSNAAELDVTKTVLVFQLRCNKVTVILFKQLAGVDGNNTVVTRLHSDTVTLHANLVL